MARYLFCNIFWYTLNKKLLKTFPILHIIFTVLKSYNTKDLKKCIYRENIRNMGPFRTIVTCFLNNKSELIRREKGLV